MAPIPSQKPSQFRPIAVGVVLAIAVVLALRLTLPESRMLALGLPGAEVAERIERELLREQTRALEFPGVANSSYRAALEEAARAQAIARAGGITGAIPIFALFAWLMLLFAASGIPSTRQAFTGISLQEIALSTLPLALLTATLGAAAGSIAAFMPAAPVVENGWRLRNVTSLGDCTLAPAAMAAAMLSACTFCSVLAGRAWKRPGQLQKTATPTSQPPAVHRLPKYAGVMSFTGIVLIGMSLPLESTSFHAAAIALVPISLMSGVVAWLVSRNSGLPFWQICLGAGVSGAVLSGWASLPLTRIGLRGAGPLFALQRGATAFALAFAFTLAARGATGGETTTGVCLLAGAVAVLTALLAGRFAVFFGVVYVWLAQKAGWDPVYAGLVNDILPVLLPVAIACDTLMALAFHARQQAGAVTVTQPAGSPAP